MIILPKIFNFIMVTEQYITTENLLKRFEFVCVFVHCECTVHVEVTGPRTGVDFTQIVRPLAQGTIFQILNVHLNDEQQQ